MKRRLALISVAFSISFISMVALSLFSMQRFNTYMDYSNQMDHTGFVITQVLKTELSLRDIDRSERGYMITKDTMYLRFLNNAVDSISKTIGKLAVMTADNRDQQKNITLLKAAVAIRIAAARDNINYVDSANTSTPSKYYFDSRQLMTDCSRKLRALEAAENKLLMERFKGEHIYEELTTDTLKYLLVIFCVVTLLLFGIMIKELRGRMKYQLELQAKIIDLKRSHSELEEIAYAASHDLQEPLRKIQVFSNMLLYQKTGSVNDEAKATLERINNSANRMQLLITDLVSLTNLTKTEELKSATSLDKVVKYTLADIEDKVAEKKAVVEVQPLPVITGYDTQLKILFRALLDNSLKFTREGIKPVITISCEIINGHELAGVNPNLLSKKFYRITCSDNGIGFDNQFITKIFQIFQRLHTQQSEYEGKGIGLAICQRIMANHEGYIIGHGEPGMGAQFKLFFPVEG